MNKTTIHIVCIIALISAMMVMPAAAQDEILWEYSTELNSPDDADRLTNGNTLITDDCNNRVIEVTPSGTIFWEYNTGLSGPFRSERLSDGNTLIGVCDGQRVIEVTTDGTIFWEYSTAPDYWPYDVHRLSNGNTLIGYDDGVIEVTTDGTIFWEYSTGAWNWVTSVDRLSNGNTLITDCNNHRIIEVTTDGTIFWEYSTGLSGPYDADRLSNGNTLITDNGNHRIIEVTTDGTIVWEYGTGLNWPNDADRLSNGNTLIADTYNNRIIEVGTPALPLEFGDAQDPTYPSLLASDGARHSETDTECLGLNINGTDWKDFELDANVPDADLFDDGLLTFALTTNNPAQTVDFEVTNNISDENLLVNILLDLNGDGDWNDPGEHVVVNQPVPIVGGEGVVVSDPFSTVGATEGSTWMRVTLTRQSITPGWDGTMASAGYAEPFGCGETEDWEVELVNVPSVETATGTGTATFESDAGTIDDLAAIAEGTLPAEGKPVGMSFPHGFFSFNITGLDNGQTVNVTITLPDAVPVGTQYWKYIGSAWVQIPIGSDDGDNVITIQLMDGGPGDADGLANGMIVDPGSPGVPPPPPEVPAMTPIGFVMVMFSLFGLVVFTTKGMNKR